MAEIIKFYEDNFDPKSYYKSYYTDDNGDELKEWFIEFLHRLFSQGKIPGKTLIDVGCGPTIQSVISASAYVPEIYMSDLLERNRNIVEKWLRGEPDAIDHSRQLKHIARLEGHNDYKMIEERIRKAVKGVFPCNIMKENPLDPKKMKFDIVVSSLCVDCYPGRKECFQSYKNISSLVRQGGYAVFQATLHGSGYIVGGIYFPGPNMDGATVQLAIEEANFKILEISEHKYPGHTALAADIKGVIMVLAVKL